MQDILPYLLNIDPFEAAGLIFGLLAVILLIKENIWTWPTGIGYVLASFVIFWKAKLYADFALNIFFLVMNIYGWWFWIFGAKKEEDEVPITYTSPGVLSMLVVVSMAGIFVVGFLLSHYTDASLPYWDSATTVLSLTGMWLTARKKIENWYFWFVVDVLATGVYFYKDLVFYSILYLIYVGLAVSGFIAWKKVITTQMAS